MESKRLIKSAIACSEAPQGRERWTLRMLADKMVELNHVESISHETVRQTLKKMQLGLIGDSLLKMQG